MLSGREAMAGDGEEGRVGERGGDGRGGESSGRVGGGLERRGEGWGSLREMDCYARQEQAGLWKLWHVVCVCVYVCCMGELLMSPHWGHWRGLGAIKHQSTDTNGLLTPN